MIVTSGHFSLSPEQRRFKDAISAYPYLLPYWDFDQRECDVEALRSMLNRFSEQENIMARFFAGVWLGENSLDFDLIIAAKSLDTSNQKVITNWMALPEFP